MLNINSPLTAEVFIITANLLVRGRSTEAIDLITGYALHLNENNCTGELVSTLKGTAFQVIDNTH